MREGKGPKAVTLLGWGGLLPSPVSKFPIGSADDGHAPQLGESWYTEKTCTTLCTCSVHSNITCSPTACKDNHVCLLQEGLLRCAAGKRSVLQGMSLQSRGAALLVLHTSSRHPSVILESDIVWPFLKDLWLNSNCHSPPPTLAWS